MALGPSEDSYGVPWPAVYGHTAAIPVAGTSVPVSGTTAGTGHGALGAESYAWICQATAEGVVERVLFLLSAANGQPMRVSLRSLVAGVPSGVAEQFRILTVTASMNDSGLLTSDGTDSGAKRAVRIGDVFAVVFEATTGSGDYSFPRMAGNITGAARDAPQMTNDSTGWVTSTANQALGAVKYADVGFVYFNGILPLTSSAGVELLYNSGSATPEFGVRFTVPARVLAHGFYWRGNLLAADVEVALFDGTTQIALSPTLDAEVEATSGATNTGLVFGVFSAAVILERGHTYRVIFRPKTVTNVSLATYAVHQAAVAAMPAGAEWYQTSRVGGVGAFTDSAASVPLMGMMYALSSKSGHLFEMEFSGAGAGWTDITEDVLLDPNVSLEYGITGAGPQDLVASTGRLSFALDNSEDNTVELLGYYSPDGPNCRAGFKRGIGVRYSFRKPFESDYYRKFVGRLMSAAAVAGQFGERRVLCDALDWINEAATVRVTVAAQLAKTHNQILTTLLAAMARQPTSTTFDTGDSTFAYALDNSQTETSPVLSEIQRLCQSEYARCYIRGGMNAGGNLRLEKRTARLASTPSVNFFGTMQGITPKANIKNRAKVTAHPRTVDAAATTVLFSKPNQANPIVNPGQTILITGRYNDPANRAQRVGGTDMVTPIVATTDYLMNAAADGSGADKTGSFTVVTVAGANQADFAITNGGGTAAYVTKLQIRGRGIYDYNPIDATTINQPSIDDFGESLAQLDMPYQSDVSVAQAISDFIVASWLTPGASEAVMRCAPRDDAEMDVLMALEPGIPIAASELVTGMNGMFFIQHVALRLVEYGPLNVEFEFLIQRALVAAYWQLGTVGFGELGVTTVLAPL